MKILRWAAGVLDKVRNEHIRGSYKVGAPRRGDDHAVRKTLALPENKRKRGRPASTTVAKDIKNANLIDVTTQDRESWRRKTRKADPK
ncbi:jg7574 [Pararge aegeria aegeria]|uniref:Jg7574 protein n=1 Tax=Pararge aegeria aegeria TaxID=348720 RepID=A0A8S4QLI1_9NEOP|nr:jg7574 [Pararge aegeria aegeria]